MAARGVPSWYLALLIVTLAAAVVLALVSAHIRLTNSGLGCADWPRCYGRIGQAADPTTAAPHATPGGATRVHRVLASTLGLLVLAVAAAALSPRLRATGWFPPALALAVMIALAVLGKWSAGLQRPAVVLANFSGGIVLAATLWWLLVGAIRTRVESPARALPRSMPQRLMILGSLAAGVQIVLGGVVSAYFAGLACGPSPTCGGNWNAGIPWLELATQFYLLELDATGRVVIGDTLTGLHMAHRMLGFVLVPLFVGIAWHLNRHGLRRSAITIVSLVTAEVALGIAAVNMALPPALVLAHYGLVLALVLALVWAAQTAGSRSHASVAR